MRSEGGRKGRWQSFKFTDKVVQILIVLYLKKKSSTLEICKIPDIFTGTFKDEERATPKNWATFIDDCLFPKRSICLVAILQERKCTTK